MQRDDWRSAKNTGATEQRRKGKRRSQRQKLMERRYHGVCQTYGRMGGAGGGGGERTYRLSVVAKPKWRDPNLRALRRAAGSYSEQSRGDQSDTDSDFQSEAEESEYETMSEQVEVEKSFGEMQIENPKLQGDQLSDIFSQDVPSLSKLERELRELAETRTQDTEGAKGESSSRNTTGKQRDSLETEDVTTFANEAFSPGLVIIEKCRVIDGQDEKGMRRKSLHPVSSQMKLLTTVNENSEEKGKAATTRTRPRRRIQEDCGQTRRESSGQFKTCIKPSFRKREGRKETA
ncbi:hypothetical protein R1sor_002632 [Riccia sorocarpa]|uniref:Uncharacterized protein n=1 Tax=Riccia sorocarpa TaxID=122646 RepID=A0ABD3H2S4_9MARC